MDTLAVATALQTQLSHLGVGHLVEYIEGSQSDGVQVRSPYSDTLTVVDHDGEFTLVARGAGGEVKLIDTEVSASAPVEELSLYLAFHALWAMHRLVDQHGTAEIAQRMPDLFDHEQLAIVFIAGHLGHELPEVRAAASSVLQSVTHLLRR